MVARVRCLVVVLASVALVVGSASLAAAQAATGSGKAAKPTTKAKAGKAGAGQAARKSKASQATGQATPAVSARPAPRTTRLHQRVRTGRTDLARRKGPAGPRAGRNLRVRKQETKLPPPRSKAAVARTPKSPVEGVLDRLRAEALRLKPRARGKLSVTFTVGRDGTPQQILILGLNDKIDLALERSLAAESLPRNLAGRRYSTTLVLRGK